MGLVRGLPADDQTTRRPASYGEWQEHQHSLDHEHTLTPSQVQVNCQVGQCRQRAGTPVLGTRDRQAHPKLLH
jgi:hypothetical protein